MREDGAARAGTPLVSTVAVKTGLFTDTAPPALLGGVCGDCSRHHFPLAFACPYCSSSAVEPTELSTTGRLWAWTSVTAAPPGYTGEVPYGFGVVELPEGIRVVTRLTEPDPARLSAGRQMSLVLSVLNVDDEGRDVLTYAFAPNEDT